VLLRADRLQTSTGEFSQFPDAAEEQAFLDEVAQPRGLHEWEQPELTHQSASGASRLDRVYCDMAVADQLDRQFGTVALPWVDQLSAHRPIHWFRRLPSGRSLSQRPIRPESCRRSGWAEQVSLRYAERRKEDPVADSSFRRLVLLKRAIRDVTEMQAETAPCELAATPQEQLSVAMAFLRAVKLHAWGKARILAERLPLLRDFVNVCRPSGSWPCTGS